MLPRTRLLVATLVAAALTVIVPATTATASPPAPQVASTVSGAWVITTPWPDRLGSLSGVAAARCGDASRWPEIARANHITQPKLLQIGVKLWVPCATATSAAPAPTPRVTAPRSGWVSPLASYRITTCYEWRQALYRNGVLISKAGLHEGLDMSAPGGTRVGAVAAGTVIRVGWRGGYGRAVEISHGGGVTSMYAHLSSIAVSKGQRVVTGQRVGGVGSTGASTGNHLHLGLYRWGADFDPTPYLEARGVPIRGC